MKRISVELLEQPPHQLRWVVSVDGVRDTSTFSEEYEALSHVYAAHGYGSGVDDPAWVRRVNAGLFIHVFSSKLPEAIAKDPGHYGLPKPPHPKTDAFCHTCSHLMFKAFVNGSYNLDGRGLRATCRHFGLKPTYKEVEMFLNTPR